MQGILAALAIVRNDHDADTCIDHHPFQRSNEGLGQSCSLRPIHDQYGATGSV
jgi:hypothetical protein